jgi:hypothetical protein
MYRLVEAERDGERSVNKACVVLEVSRAAYYEWSKQEPSAREREDHELTVNLPKQDPSICRRYGLTKPIPASNPYQSAIGGQRS